MKINQKGAMDFMFMGAVIVLVAGATFAFWRINEANNTVSNTAENAAFENELKFESKNFGQQTSADREGWLTYTSTELGIQFDFPVEWGDVEELIHVPDEIPGITYGAGRHTLITFSNNSGDPPTNDSWYNISISAESPDFTEIGTDDERYNWRSWEAVYRRFRNSNGVYQYRSSVANNNEYRDLPGQDKITDAQLDSFDAINVGYPLERYATQSPQQQWYMNSTMFNFSGTTYDNFTVTLAVPEEGSSVVDQATYDEFLESFMLLAT